MAVNKRWFRTDIKGASLTVNGGQTFQISHLEASFGLNEIPRAQVFVAVGQSVNTTESTEPLSPNTLRLYAALGRTPPGNASIHNSIEFTNTRSPATIQLTLSGDWDMSGRSWPEQGVTIFDGLVTGISYRKAGEQVFAVVSLIHWSAKLGYSSTLSKFSHPSNPVNLAFNGTIPEKDAGSADTREGSGPSQTLTQYINGSILTPSQLSTDMWAGFADVLKGLANEDLMQFEGRANRAGTRTANSTALDALAKFEGAGTLARRYSVPLVIDEPEGIGIALAGSIMSCVTESQIQAYFGTTFWDVLVGAWANDFMFSVVPMSDRALIVPITPGQRLPWRTVQVNDYGGLDQNSLVPTPLRAVLLSGGEMSATNAEDANTQDEGIGGVFQPTATDSDGVILMRRAPSWMCKILSQAMSNDDSTGVDQGDPPNCATDPQPADTGNSQIAAIAQARPQQKRLLDRFAQELFLRNSLEGRTGLITGKLRFDIAPGSTLMLKGSPEPVLGTEDVLSQDLYALVVRTAFVIDCEAKQAQTTFQLSHIRTATENQDDRYSTDRHSLYSQAYLGAPLVPEYEFA